MQSGVVFANSAVKLRTSVSNKNRIVDMRVHMDCPGCESKIRRALQKLKGVDTIDIDMRMQKVTVTGWAEQRKVLNAVRKTGRRAELWPFPYNAEYHSYTHHYHHQHHLTTPATSSYNYYKHGYDGHVHGYYHRQAHSTILDDRANSLFNDDNPHACSVM
ncbi:heavy metal-associated isoprenylated plant protein 28 isoform X1 [Amborella trichopoda]|uniref:heavy metal-associated isoprenylated plant protein 28 isoform X1 n=1 Tax=Amborella trichopoda TaxID=13333 RepID=UPI0009BED5CA|nr:heavy metal-associated isoprenylated plant protein 28 isoform X1 [Amborella trichopoda]XP_020527943.1 heavy metal-associated isoprenylated plant protein 28 isoform X1 [Amborella trichopoda]|eukprot:XP_011626258.2 heavy metal-associated isoprenylated plant protein 28 isoform X1 [Amborella trichopoda]